jgi:hypoxanthine phosphoribosyltransferase
MNDIYTTEVYITEAVIAQRVQAIANTINKDYANMELTVVCVLKGAFVFCADLIKKIQLPLQLDFVAVSSYGNLQQSSGKVKVEMDLSTNIEGKHVLLVEDIVDTGLTIHFLKGWLWSRNPASLKLASLLYKPNNLKHEVEIDYLAFEIEDKFVIGYGLDYAGRYRELPFIGILNAGH